MADAMPHAATFTRLRASSLHGVGVFAIRDIPENFPLFQGDDLPVCKVSEAEVAQIADDAIRQLYADFCPLIDGYFIAPQNFNCLTQAWYVNHSESPNVAMDSSLQFTTIRAIAEGQEVTFDYRTLAASIKAIHPT
jgi:hypothetical protein